jgi:hypothetical protein
MSVVTQRRGQDFRLALAAAVAIAMLLLSACAGAGSMGDEEPGLRTQPPSGSVTPPAADLLPNTMVPGAGLVGSGTPVAGSGAAGDGVAAPSGVAGMGSTEPGAPSPMTPSGYVNLAPPMGEPFDPANATPVTPEPPPGWTWYEVDGTFCRDGSKNGLYVRHTASDKLLIYFEGGGACTTPGFCHFNPHSVNHVLTGDGETVIGTVFAVGEGRQQPGAYTFGTLDGIFAEAKDQNPYKGWNMAYIPYCTGDVHFGSNPDGMVPNLPEKQKFVGYLNNRIFLGRLAATFKGKVDHVVATGASAGSFGAALNYSMIADTFAGAQVDAVLDSGAPFEDAQWPACMQQAWRTIWKLNDSLPPDCPGCFNADGGNMLALADFLIEKHPTGNLAAISSLHDEVIRLFFAPGQDDCALIQTADPFEITAGQILGGTIFPAETYEAGLMALRAKYLSTDRLATYFFGGDISTLHQHTFRPRFYEPVAGGKSMAQFTAEFLAGTMTQVGP